MKTWWFWITLMTQGGGGLALVAAENKVQAQQLVEEWWSGLSCSGFSYLPELSEEMSELLREHDGPAGVISHKIFYGGD